MGIFNRRAEGIDVRQRGGGLRLSIASMVSYSQYRAQILSPFRRRNRGEGLEIKVRTTGSVRIGLVSEEFLPQGLRLSPDLQQTLHSDGGRGEWGNWTYKTSGYVGGSTFARD